MVHVEFIQRNVG